MKTLDIMFTRGDAFTQPGGIILRQKDDGEFITHAFNRLPHTRDPRDFFWGHYFNPDLPGAEGRARADFKERCDKVRFAEIAESVIIAKGDEGFDVSGHWENENV